MSLKTLSDISAQLSLRDHGMFNRDVFVISDAKLNKIIFIYSKVHLNFLLSDQSKLNSNL